MPLQGMSARTIQAGARQIDKSENARGLKNAGLATNADISQSGSTADDRWTAAIAQTDVSCF